MHAIFISFPRSEGSNADQVVLGSYTTKLQSKTLELFIQNLESPVSKPVPMYVCMYV